MDDVTQKAIKKFPHRAVDIAQSYDKKQIACKQWLYDELKKLRLPQPKRIYIAGSWYGNILVPYLRKLYNCELCLRDIDEETLKIAKMYNPDVKVDCVDCTSVEHKYFVINTSCEHMDPLIIKPRSYVVLQSNNYKEIEDHVNCVDSPEELANQYSVVETYYAGKLDFEKYTRYMVIGRV